MRRQIRAGRRRGGVSVHARTCSCPGDFSQPPATSFWFRTSGSSIGGAPASRLPRGAASGEMCSLGCLPPPPPHLCTSPPACTTHFGAVLPWPPSGISGVSSPVCSRVPIQLSQAGGRTGGDVSGHWECRPNSPVVAGLGRRPGEASSEDTGQGTWPHLSPSLGGKQGLFPPSP